MRSRFAVLLAVAIVCVTTAVAGWSPEQQVTNNNTTNSLGHYNTRNIVVAANGVRHLVWTRGGIYYKRWYPATGWTPDYELTTIKYSSGPAIALDSNGTDIHVVWYGLAGSGRQATRHIYYQKCVPTPSGNGGWVGVPRDITPGTIGRPSKFAPSVACYQGRVVVTWEETSSDSVGFCECVNGVWQAPILLDISGGTGQLENVMSFYPNIAVDPQARYGDVFICSVVCSDWLRAYVMRRQNGIWQSAECAIDGTGFDVFFPVLEVDPSTGYPHIVCGTDVDINHTDWTPGSGWLPVELISDPNATVTGRVSICFSGGSAFAAWTEQSPDGVRGIRYRIGQYGSWSTPAWITSGYSDNNPKLAVRSNGDVYAVWEDGRTSRPQIWGRLYTPGSYGPQAEPVATAQSRFDLFPNPIKGGRVTVQYSLPRAGQMTVTVLDVSGRAVRTQEFAANDRGSAAIDASGLNAGVYVARLTAGGMTVSKSFVVER
jgi:hypothetical protein